MINIVSSILKQSLFPILVESCYNSASEMWEINKLASIIIYLTGFILTIPGNLILIGIIFLIIYLRRYR